MGGWNTRVRPFVPSHSVLETNPRWREAMPIYMTFEEAMGHIKQGALLQREGWNGKGMFVFLVRGSTFNVNRAPLSEIYPEGTEINYHGHIDMKMADGRIMPWTPSQADMLAADWQVVN